MKRILVFIFFFVVIVSDVTRGQTFFTLKGQVNFLSEMPEERIDATNNSVAAQLLFANGHGQFIIPIKSFKFKKALLQEHFNENYLESDTYPKATYKYTIDNTASVPLDKPGRYAVQTNGIITIKKISKTIAVPGYINVVNDSTIRLEASFLLDPTDYDIKIPSPVEKKIAKNIRINVNSTLNKK